MTVKLVGSSSGSVSLAAPASTTGGANIEFKLPVADGSANQILKTDGSGQLSFASNLVVDSSGNLGLGTTAPDQMLHLNKTSGDTYLRLQGGTNQGTLIHATDGTLLGGFVSGGAVGGGTSDMAMRVESGNNMLFAHGTTERMRIHSGGQVSLGNTTTNVTATGITLQPNSISSFLTVDNHTLYIGRGGSNGEVIRFNRSSTDVGSISVTTTSTTYNTSSDYRLKENVTAISDGITRLKTLKPYRFNFKADKDTTVDGFLAHEVTAVPEAITGTKDAVDSDNKPVYQGIDQSKLVPLLTAALQEAVAKIEILETKVAALEAK